MKIKWLLAILRSFGLAWFFLSGVLFVLLAFSEKEFRLLWWGIPFCIIWLLWLPLELWDFGKRKDSK